MPSNTNLTAFFDAINGVVQKISAEVAVLRGNSETVNIDSLDATTVTSITSDNNPFVNGTNDADTLLVENEGLFNIIRANGGDDVIVGNGGINLILGGSGVDTSDYSFLNNDDGSGVFVDLGNRFAVTGANGIDILGSIENVIGTNNNDILLGNSQGNVFLGNGGSDFIDGRGGVDVAQLFGQAEEYTVVASYTDDESGVVTTTLSRTVGEGDDATTELVTLVNIELIQFEVPSEDGEIEVFSVGLGEDSGSAIARDDDVSVAENGEVLGLNLLDNDTLINAIAAEVVGGVTLQGEAGPVGPTAIPGIPGGDTISSAFGTLQLNGDGTLHFEANTPAAEALAEGETVTEVFVYSVLGGDEAEITFTITGTNDAPTVAAALEETAAEGDGSFEVNLLAGASDVDASDVLSVTGLPDELPAGISVDGSTLTVDPSNAAFDSLAVGEETEIVINYTVSDDNDPAGTVSQTATITITGTNDVATITGVAVGTVEEAGGVENGNEGTPSVSGSLTVADVDNGEAVFAPVDASALATTFGTFTFDSATGDYNFTLDQVAADSLNDGDVETAVLTVSSLDDTATQDITITINGTNDAAVIAGDTTNTVIEAGDSDIADGEPQEEVGNSPISGTLTSDDVDNDNNVFIADGGDATYGSFTIDEAGGYTYTLNNGNIFVNALQVGDTLTDTFTVQSEDGTSQDVTITIEGTNDNPYVVGGPPERDIWELPEDLDDSTNPLVQTRFVSGTIELFDIDSDFGLADDGLGRSGNLDDDSGFVEISDLVSIVNQQVTFDPANSSTEIPDSTIFANLFVLEVERGPFDSQEIDASNALLTYTVRVADDAIEFLGEGDTLTLTQTIRIEDGDGGFVDADIIVNARGRNDEIGVEVSTPAGNVTEAEGFGAQDIATSGVLTIDDVDFGDDVSITVQNDVTATLDGEDFDVGGIADILAGSFVFNDGDNITTVGRTVDPDNPDGVFNVDFDFSAANVNLDFLAKDEELVVSFPIEVSDGYTTDWVTIDITFIGTNDGPTIVSGATTPGDVTEDELDDSVPFHTTTSSFVVEDVDNPEDLVATPLGAPISVELRPFVDNAIVPGIEAELDATTGEFDAFAEVVFDTVEENDGTIVVDFDFAVPNSAIQFLGQNDELLVTYEIEVSDGHKTVTQPITVTIIGTNDDPIISAIAPQTVNAPQDIVELTGDILVTDIDIGDVLTASIDSSTAVYSGGDLPDDVDVSVLTASDVLTFTPNAVTGLGGETTLGYSYDPAAADLDFLAVGDTLTLTFDIRVEDGEGGFDNTPLVITIEGTNDAPVVSDITSDAELVEDGLSVATGDLIIDGNASDVDTGDALSAGTINFGEVIATVADNGDRTINGQFGTLVVTAAGAFTYTLFDTSTAEGALLNALAEDEAASDIFSFTVIDDEGGESSIQTLTLDITGSNDVPTVGDPILASGAEDTGNIVVTQEALLAGADDVDNGAELTAVFDVPSLPDGFSIDDDGNLVVDTSDASFQSLVAGEEVLINVEFDVQDENGAAVAQSLDFTITGTNDTPTVSIPSINFGVVQEDEIPRDDEGDFSINLLDAAGADDVDVGQDGIAEADTLQVENFQGTLSLTATSEEDNDGNGEVDSLTGSTPIALPLDILAEAGLVTLSSSGDLTIDDTLLDVLQEFIGEGDSLSIDASFDIVDAQGAEVNEGFSNDASVSVTIEGNDALDSTDQNLQAGGEVPDGDFVAPGDADDVYSETNAPDFLVPQFGPDGSGDDASTIA